MLGLDVWNGSSSQVQSFKNRTNVTFPLLRDAGRIPGRPFNMEELVVVDPDGIVRFSRNGLSSSVSAAQTVVEDLLSKMPSPVPVIAVQEQSINFDAIDAGQTGQRTITITNTGTGSLEVTGIESDVPGLTFDTTMFTLAPNGSQTVTVTFPSSMEGTFSGNITISSNDPEQATQTLSVSIIVKVPSANSRADFNGDKVVNITDFLLFVEAFGSTNSQFDINGDGVVDVTDFLLFVEAFGKTVDG